MPESFDAFYGRTVWNVTSAMHAHAAGDSAADHAIREAYARAYQQWYQVGADPDPEGWVLAAARQAYERRRPAAAPAGAEPGPELAAPPDPRSWPGLYRAETGAAAAPPDSTTAGPELDSFTLAPPPGGAGPGDQDWLFTRPGGAAPPPAPPEDEDWMFAGPAGALPPGRPRRRGRRPGGLIALAAAALVIVAGVAVFAVTRHPASRPASPHPAAATPQSGARPANGLLGAGQTGPRSAIPWSKLGEDVTGWTLAAVSSAPAGSTGPGTITIDLVDPAGGRYTDQTWSPAAAPQLLAWSSDHTRALFALPGAAAASRYELLALKTGTRTALALPSDVTAVGFTRPSGDAVLAVAQTSARDVLQRYDLTGNLQAAVTRQPRQAGQGDLQPGCSELACAVSSPDGIFDVWGIRGGAMQVISNAGGKARTLRVPGGGSSCVPLTWWDSSTVLASCQSPADALWLVPSSGAAPTRLAAGTAGQAGAGVLTGAWHAAGTSYVTVTSTRQCARSSAGTGGLTLRRLQSGGSQKISIPGSTGNRDQVVSAAAGRLLVLAQTSCPGSASLLAVNPASGKATTLLAARAGQAGVLAAAPDGNGLVAPGR